MLAITCPALKAPEELPAAQQALASALVLASAMFVVISLGSVSPLRAQSLERDIVSSESPAIDGNFPQDALGSRRQKQSQQNPV